MYFQPFLNTALLSMLVVKVNISNNFIYQQGYKVLHRKESPADKTNINRDKTAENDETSCYLDMIVGCLIHKLHIVF